MSLGQIYRTLLLVLPFIGKYPAAEVDPSQKIDFSIYYETLCIDSKFYITNVFMEAYKIFADYLNVRFIPFGKAIIKEDGTEYTCQHGKEECFRNMIHGCALNSLTPGDEQVDFVYCAMRNRSISSIQECTSQRGLSWETIQNCAHGEQGVTLTLSAQDETLTATGGPLKFVPTIILNNAFSQAAHDLAFRDPMVAICQYLRSHPQCEGLIII